MNKFIKKKEINFYEAMRCLDKVIPIFIDDNVYQICPEKEKLKRFNGKEFDFHCSFSLQYLLFEAHFFYAEIKEEIICSVPKEKIDEVIKIIEDCKDHGCLYPSTQILIIKKLNEWKN